MIKAIVEINFCANLRDHLMVGYTALNRGILVRIQVPQICLEIGSAPEAHPPLAENRSPAARKSPANLGHPPTHKATDG